VIDAATGAVRGTVDLGGEVGNVVYDPVADQMLVPVQGRGDLAIINPATLAVVRRVPLPGCQHGHGLALDPESRLGFVGCEGNATLATVDLTTGQVTATLPVGDTPTYWPTTRARTGSTSPPRTAPSASWTAPAEARP